MTDPAIVNDQEASPSQPQEDDLKLLSRPSGGALIERMRQWLARDRHVRTVLKKFIGDPANLRECTSSYSSAPLARMLCIYAYGVVVALTEDPELYTTLWARQALPAFYYTFMLSRKHPSQPSKRGLTITLNGLGVHLFGAAWVDLELPPKTRHWNINAKGKRAPPLACAQLDLLVRLLSPQGGLGPLIIPNCTEWCRAGAHNDICARERERSLQLLTSALDTVVAFRCECPVYVYILKNGRT
jgi:hypothetical protein